ncbi:MAG: putative molybdenum carrier protein [Magnetococcales bacterium]|nr:putative molybdenum carrier protein [Magnetococcales bacterium]
MFRKIVSGGQTGVDRAALDFAQAHNLPAGGWCPKGRRADDGAIPAGYPLRETSTSDYRQRTLKNVLESDGTLILHHGTLHGGTLLTLRMARSLNKPHRAFNLRGNVDLSAVRDWLEQSRIDTLNVAGPRERGFPGIHDHAKEFLAALFRGEVVWMRPVTDA